MLDFYFDKSCSILIKVKKYTFQFSSISLGTKVTAESNVFARSPCTYVCFSINNLQVDVIHLIYETKTHFQGGARIFIIKGIIETIKAHLSGGTNSASISLILKTKFPLTSYALFSALYFVNDQWSKENKCFHPSTYSKLN